MFDEALLAYNKSLKLYELQNIHDLIKLTTEVKYKFNEYNHKEIVESEPDFLNNYGKSSNPSE